MRWDTIIFDCDGVLVDSERLGNEVLVDYVEQFGVNLTVDEALARFQGVRMADCVSEIERLRGASLPESFVSGFRERIAKAFTDRLQPIDGALDLIGSLTVPFCVASSGPRAKVELSLSVTGLLSHFEGRIFSSYEVGAWKPSPDLFLHAARAMGADPRKCAVIEDSLPGVLAGLAAKMQVFALQPQRADPRIPADVRVVRNLRDLSPVFGKQGDAV